MHARKYSSDFDVHLVTPNTIPEIARRTGRSEESLRKAYDEGVKKNHAVMILTSDFLPKRTQLEIAAAYATGKCYYQSREDEINGTQFWICVIHDELSKYKVNEGSRLPCMKLEP